MDKFIKVENYPQHDFIKINANFSVTVAKIPGTDTTKVTVPNATGISHQYIIKSAELSEFIREIKYDIQRHLEYVGDNIRQRYLEQEQEERWGD